MIATQLLQVVVTVWASAHPVTYTIPKLYPATDRGMAACQSTANKLFANRKVGTFKRMVIDCVPTVMRDS
jgi:hypothetical protein